MLGRLNLGDDWTYWTDPSTGKKRRVIPTIPTSSRSSGNHVDIHNSEVGKIFQHAAGMKNFLVFSKREWIDEKTKLALEKWTVMVMRTPMPKGQVLNIQAIRSQQPLAVIRGYVLNDTKGWPSSLTVKLMTREYQHADAEIELCDKKIIDEIMDMVKAKVDKFDTTFLKIENDLKFGKINWRVAAKKQEELGPIAGPWKRLKKFLEGRCK